MKKYFREVKNENGIGTKPVDASKEDIEKALKIHKGTMAIRVKIEDLQKELKLLENTCDHEIRYDLPGFMYDIRICAGCGKNLGLI